MTKTRPLLTLLLCGILTVVCSVGASPPAGAIANGGYDSTQPGFDACPLPSTATMATWWTYSPYWWYSVYIGGSNALCPPGNISSWLNTVNDSGLHWNFEYTWVGLQPPCQNMYPSKFSSDPATAYGQGETEAQAAVNQLTADGVANNAQSTPLIYDLETAGNGTCQAAINSFVQGWVYWLKLAPAQVPGVYGSVCGSNLAALAGLSPPPTFIWGAYYDGNPNTADLYCVPSTDWTHQQRLKQYDQNVSRTYGNIKLTVDEDCANSLTTPFGATNVNCN